MLRQPVLRSLGNAEVDDLRHRLAVLHRHQHVRGFDVAVDDPFVVGVLDALADLHEQRFSRSSGGSAVAGRSRLGDRDAP